VNPDNSWHGSDDEPEREAAAASDFFHDPYVGHGPTRYEGIERDEYDPGDAVSGSVTLDQRLAILAAFEELGLKRWPDQGTAIADALRARGVGWYWDTDLIRLSRRQAGIVLEALHERGRARLVKFPGGNSMPRDAAEAYVHMMQAGAAALTYVSMPDKWPGYVAWLEQDAGKSGIPPGHGDQFRQLYAAWGMHLLAIAQAGQGMVDK
jgi:hypothetical protein